MSKLKINISDLFDLSGAIIYNPDDYRPSVNVSIDSRTVRKNTLFVAIKGERFDGHQFIEEAVKNGANAILVDEKFYRKLDNIKVPIITVPDTIKAYGEIANMWRHKLGAKVVSITGSNGKTGTKDIVAELLASKYKVLKTTANNNNHIGVPLTILSAKAGTEILVLEHGTNHFGEIEYTAKIAQPDIALITNIGASHLEFLKDLDGVYKEKSKLIQECLDNNGTIACNQNDPIIRRNNRKVSQRITYGFSGKSEFVGKILGYDDFGRTKIKITSGKITFSYLLPLYGESNAKNFLAAFAIARRLGVSKSAINKAVKKLEAPKGRLSVIELNNSILIDDTYNSNPASVKAALKFLKNIRLYKNSVLILGDMFELGSGAIKMHKELAKEIKSIKKVNVLCLGKMMRSLSAELERMNISSTHFRTRNQLSKYLLKSDFNGSKILVKGSRGMKMEEFVEIIKSKAV